MSRSAPVRKRVGEGSVTMWKGISRFGSLRNTVRSTETVPARQSGRTRRNTSSASALLRLLPKPLSVSTQ